jgi:hypothetical protein
MRQTINMNHQIKLSLSIIIAIISPIWLFSQRMPDKVYSSSIKTVKLFPKNNQLAIPILALNQGDEMELHFDEMGLSPKNYFYTYQLCNADWTEAAWSPFDYIKGFQQNRISTYRISSIAKNPYVHYQIVLPERNAIPTRSGNYLLKVFQDADTSKLLFTKRFYIVDKQTNIGAQFLQPFDFQITRTHQKIQLVVNAPQLQMINPQQFKTTILQNGRWDNAAINIQPTFIRGNTLEFNTEQDCVFPAGKEYRWLDLQSFRFESDRVERINRLEFPFQVTVKQDKVRSSLQYLYYRDTNGFSEIMNSESLNPWWQSDYAEVVFSIAPPNGQAFYGVNMYLLGELTGNQIGDTSLMQFDAKQGVYIKKLFLKQGYYNYTYVTRDTKKNTAKADPSITEGNYWETENEYNILVYYRAIGGRHDELVGYTVVNTFNSQRRF